MEILIRLWKLDVKTSCNCHNYKLDHNYQLQNLLTTRTSRNVKDMFKGHWTTLKRIVRISNKIIKNLGHMRTLWRHVSKDDRDVTGTPNNEKTSKRCLITLRELYRTLKKCWEMLGSFRKKFNNVRQHQKTLSIAQKNQGMIGRCKSKPKCFKNYH